MFTPGPWAREYPDDQLIAVLAPDKEYDTFLYIAEINPCDDERMTDEQYESNANLIAAAPEMYEALKEIQWYHEHNEYEAQQQGHKRLTERIRMVDEALAKADGKS